MSFTEQNIEQLVAQHYNLIVKAKTLNGYDEQNFLLTDESGGQFIGKISTDAHDYHFLEAQIKILDHLSQSGIANKFQQVIPNRTAQSLTAITLNGNQYYLRILNFLHGNFWVEEQQHSNELQVDLGIFLGKMDSALAGFFHPSINRYYEWDIRNALDARKDLHYIKDHEKRRIADYFLLQFEMEVLPKLPSLRTAVIHNDANDYNVLVSGNSIVGLIDFGDMVFSQVINNVAIACTYAMLDKENPVMVAANVVKGYHHENPLTETEIEVLYYLICARLCISVTKSAYNASLQSDNQHHFITERPAWDLLFKLIKTNPVLVENELRIACGYTPIIKQDDDYATLLKERKELIGRNLSISYKKKLKIIKGAFQYLYDDKGRTYIDCVNNVSHVGHCHPTVVKAMQQQIATLNTNTRYLNDNLTNYAKMLCATLPPSLNVCFFTNSGSEANDLAIRMSRHFTKQKDVIVLDHAYHGTSTVAMELSPYKFDGKGGFGQPPHIHKAQNPDLYRGEYRYEDKDAGAQYAKSVQQLIEKLEKEDKAPAAFICETLLGVGGQIPLPENYLEEVYKYVRSAGGVCIADEVQVGFGRVGEKFWGFELQNVVPDMVVLGKPIGNGHPLAAVVTTTEIAEAFNNGMEYFNTFGGNPVSMTTGIAVLTTIQSEEMQQHALETGNYLMAGLSSLKEKHPIIGDVRGYGLFVGAELIRNKETLEPAVPEIDEIVEKMKERGFLLSTDGPLYNVLKIKPPMVFNHDNADALVRNLDEVLVEMNLNEGKNQEC
ncbi:aminotransferase class III-fold pyridoxal phosphate-dependent enzyme [Solitalea canadensis]|uniref:4-aminobutyrate aminotransferase family protein n=1 Tax=Solitalea canadensis (strain ATCC 29591 / DSM 3403 / JCM 21819 / LMG 8368 / NBRC 15130 / NCIMB 12057 / USAM 9D) TaxID=929556 RepID=H8KVE9_SOLCM|nr:aminotransferase class III-fold pyridoxal phosphate-dependent enzyme [Solitalea canadensis]AFD06329.1 4-aminobutyrate aminotransferase family protein [Solitalea canadensis DSM 3403]